MILIAILILFIVFIVLWYMGKLPGCASTLAQKRLEERAKIVVQQSKRIKD